MDFHIVKMIKCKKFINNSMKIVKIIGTPTED